MEERSTSASEVAHGTAYKDAQGRILACVCHTRISDDGPLAADLVPNIAHPDPEGLPCTYSEAEDSPLTATRRKMEQLNRPLYSALGSNGTYPKPEIPQRDTVFVVGNGPSLARNGALLRSLLLEKTGIITTNRALKMVPGLRPTFHMVHDPTASPAWFDGVDVSSDQLIADVCVNHDVACLPWGKFWWCRPAGSIPANTYRFVVENLPGMLSFWYGFSVSFDAIQLALRMGARRVVLVGHDLSMQNGDVHPGEGASPGEKLLAENDVFRGLPVVTTRGMKMIAEKLRWAFFMAKLTRPELEFVNASERGILGGQQPDMTLPDGRPFEIRRQTLADAVMREEKYEPVLHR